MLERVMRAIRAAEPVPKVIAGRIRCEIVPRPVAGSHPRVTAKSTISISPSQKTGIETPNRATSMLALSKMEFRFVAEIIPATTPMSMAIAIAATANSTVLGNLSHISVVTGLLL